MSVCETVETMVAFMGPNKVSLSDVKNGERVGIICANGHALKKFSTCFKHINLKNVKQSPGPAEWHLKWQGKFPVEFREKEFPHRYPMCSARRADIFTGNRVVEFQNSEISPTDVRLRNQDYGVYGYKPIWVINGHPGVKIVGQLLKFNKTYAWKHSYFHGCDSVLVDVDGRLYRFIPENVVNGTVAISGSSEHDDFVLNVDALTVKAIQPITLVNEQSPLHSSPYEEPQCELSRPMPTIHIKQQGAGNGKTYGLVKQLTSTQFQTYSNVIMITKTHPARHIIYNEMNQQYRKSTNTPMTVVENDIKFAIVKIQGRHVIFTVIDSLISRINPGKGEPSMLDQYLARAINVADPHTQIGKTISYNKHKVTLGPDVCIVCDETQDLHPPYADALIRIVKEYGVSLWAVGDLLQSITIGVGGDNAFSTLIDYDSPDVNKVMPKGINICRRFEVKGLAEFVNRVVDFKTLKLPPVSTLEGLKDPPNNLSPVTVRYMESTYRVINQNHVDSVMNIYEDEVINFGREPNSFLIITPFCSGNTGKLMQMITAEITKFWQKKTGATQYARHAVFHKSENGQAINLSTSDNATRIVSIHSSKGDGRDVVIVVGLTEAALQKYCNDCDWIDMAASRPVIYESMLHVAITRAKQKMYVLIEANGDDIHRRMAFDEYDDGKTVIDPPLVRSRTWVFLYKMIDHLNSINNKYVDEILKLLSKSSKVKRDIIELPHHGIRYKCMCIWFFLCADKSARESNSRKVFDQLQHYKVRVYTDTMKYYRAREGASKPSNETGHYEIPYLSMDNEPRRDYKKYLNIITDVTEHVIAHVKEWLMRFETDLCPLEIVVVNYILDIIYNGKYAEVSMMELYDVVHDYMNANIDPWRHKMCRCNSLRSGEQIRSTDDYFLVKHYETFNKYAAEVKKFTENHKFMKYEHYQIMPSIQGANSDTKSEEKSEEKITEASIHEKWISVGYDQRDLYMFYIRPNFESTDLKRAVYKAAIDAALIMAHPAIKDRPENIYAVLIDLNGVHRFCVTANKTFLEHSWLGDIQHVVANKLASEFESLKRYAWCWYKKWNRQGGSLRERYLMDVKEYNWDAKAKDHKIMSDIELIMLDKINKIGEWDVEKIHAIIIESANEEATKIVHKCFKVENGSPKTEKWSCRHRVIFCVRSAYSPTRRRGTINARPAPRLIPPKKYSQNYFRSHYRHKPKCNVT